MNRKNVPAVLLLLLLTLSVLSVKSQNAFDSLDVNNINARFYSGGDMFWDLVGFPKFEAPQQSNPAAKRHSMFAAGLWIGGVDQGGGLHLAGQTYRQSGLDYWSGPVDVSSSSPINFDTIWTITRSEINAFVAEYSTNGSIANPGLYPNVFAWPTEYEDSNGNIVQLAPYADLNSNLQYEPALGEYPIMEGDKMLYWVFNDAANPHTETGGQQMGIEVQAFAFGYDCPANPAINNTIFLRYQIVNRSTYTFNNTYIGMWADTDIGMFSDDYVGVDTLRGMMFGYNGDPLDDGAAGYGTNPPAQGITLLQGPLDDTGAPMDRYTNFVYYENDFSVRGNPITAAHHYNLMQSVWKDSLQMVRNGTTGHPQDGSGPPTKFMLDGDGGWCGGTATGWSEVSANNTPFDRRGLASVGPFTMAPGEVNDLVYAFTYARGFYNDNLGSVCELQTSVDSLRNFFNSGSPSPCAGNPSGNNNDVWPGDCNSDNVANVFDVLAIGYAYGDTGLPRSNASLLWTGQPAAAWGDTLPTYGTDFKHIDCDGDSIIDSLDVLGIAQNYGYVHPKGTGVNTGAPIITLTIEEDSLEAGDTAHVTISLGDSLNPIDSLYGIAVSIQYDPTLVEPSGIKVHYDDCWLGVQGNTLMPMDKNQHFRGQLDIGLTRIDHLNANGHGNLVKINVVTIDNISGKNEAIAKTLGMQIVEMQAVTRDFEDLQFDMSGDSTVVYQEGTSLPPIPVERTIKVYPNPAHNLVRIEAPGAELQELKIYNLLGQSMIHQSVSGEKHALRLESLPAGTYALEIRTNMGVYRQRLVVNR